MRRLLILAALLHAGSGCASSYTPYYDGWCQSSRVHKDKTPTFTLDQAQTLCERDNANLISFHSKERMDLYSKGTEWAGLMIGVKCSNRTSRFEWSDGSRMDYTNFADPKCASPSYVCSQGETFMIGSGGKWIPWVPSYDDYYHEDDSFFLCLAQRLIDTPCDDFLLMKSPVGDQCYGLGKSEWSASEAEKSCWLIYNDPPTKLLSIHDDESNNFLRRYLVSNLRKPSNDAFIGLRLATNGTFYWTDGTTVTYTNLANPDPKPNADGTETCFVMRLTDGKWDEANCQINWASDDQKERPALCGRFPFSFPQQPAGCPVKMDYGDGEEFFSPSYPLSGNDGPVLCEYTMTARPGEAVLFKIARIEANQCCDSLTLYHEGEKMHSWSGFQMEIEPPTWEFGPYEKYTMVWNATNPSGTRGFHVKVKSVPKDHIAAIREEQEEKKRQELRAKRSFRDSLEVVDVE